MSNKNIAYTNEYKKYRDEIRYVFDEKYKCYDVETKLLSDGKHTLITTYYSDDSYEISKYNIHASKTQVIDSMKNKVAEFENINHDGNIFSVVEHSNGKNYLIFSIDLYGYSIMDLSNYNVYHYIPEESFSGHKETFIWTEAYYCKENNIIAVDGCYWACPFCTEFFDFSNPEELPFKCIYSSYEMEDEISIENDVTPIHWNSDGTIVLSCCTDDEGNRQIQKTIDIVSRIK